MWGSGFILTRINCAFSQMHAHTHTTTITPTAPKTSIPLDLNRLRWFEMRTMIYWQRLGEVGVGWWKFMLGTAEVVTEQGWGGACMWVWVGGWGSRFILVKLQLLHSAMQRFQSANFMHELLLSITPSLNAFLIYTSVKFLPRGIPQNTCSRRYRKSCGYKARNRTAQQMHLYTSLYIKVLLSKPFVLGFCWSGLCKVVQQAKQCGQEDEFNIMLHNSVLPSCLQLKRILLFGRLLFVFIV